MRDLTSPDSFIDLGFYYLISAALQRRVWWGGVERPLFPNLYILLVGPASVGKGLTIKEVTKFLTFHKFKDKDNEFGSLGGEKIMVETAQKMIEQHDLDNSVTTLKRAFLEEKKLFNVLADSTTFESMIEEHMKSVRFISVPPNTIDDPLGKMVRFNKYKHSSANILLEESATLFRQKAEDVPKYLLRAYDCEDYKHQTIGRGINLVVNPCLGLFAGTTPTWLIGNMSNDLINDGFISRTIIAFEDLPRFHRYDMSIKDKEQIEAKAEILKHLFRLSKVFGEVKKTPEAYTFMKTYVEEVLPKERTNKSNKLDTYYGRKRIHIEKLGMAIHFSNSTSMTIGIEPFLKALDILNKLEVRMDKALITEGKNPMARAISKILDYLSKNGETFKLDLHAALLQNSDLDIQVQMNALRFLSDSKKIKITKRMLNGKTEIYYDLTY